MAVDLVDSAEGVGGPVPGCHMGGGWVWLFVCVYLVWVYFLSLFVLDLKERV